jgi:hypothetical protein
MAVEERSLFDNQSPGRNVAGDVCRPAEHKFTGVNFTLDRSVYFRYRNIYYGTTQLRPHTYRKGPLLGTDVAAEVPINAERCFESNFAGKIQDIPNKAEPVVLGYIYSRDAFFASCNCLSTHGFLLSDLC